LSIPLIGTGTTGTLWSFSLFHFSLLYQAFEGKHQLVGYADGKALDAEMLVYLHRVEVRAQNIETNNGFIIDEIYGERLLIDN